MSSKSTVPQDIPTRHKVGLWSAGGLGVIALIIAIVALLLALLYFPPGRVEWTTQTVTASGGGATVKIRNMVVYEIAGPSDNSQTTSVTLSEGKSGQSFAIANTAAGGGGSLIVGVGNGNVEIPAGMGVMFIKSDNRIVPLRELMGLQN